MDFDMNLIAYCGLYCDQCSGRVAHEEQDRRHLEHFPAKYQMGRAELADFACEGCKGRNVCGPCKIKACASAQDIESCARCGGFPCELLVAFENDGVPHHRQAVENLRSIRALGVDVWFRNLTPALRCHCGERQSWYHTCPIHRTDSD